MRKTSVILLCLLLTVPSFARIITVDDDAPADFDNIQAAINDANAGDTVVVADGNYTGTGNRDIDFLGKAITVRSENGPANCIIDCNATSSNKHKGFYFDNNEGRDSVLEGFTIIRGYDVAGGGILCNYSGPTINNCIIRDNTADMGGGIMCHWPPVPKITNCIITGNSATIEGGGIANYTWPDLTVVNCLITNNTAPWGGALFSQVDDMIVTNCTIQW